MELLRELMRLQDERGWLDDDTLRRLSRERNVPLYRLEGLVSFYPAFRRSPPPKYSVHVCRDVSCAMHGCSSLSKELQSSCSGRRDVEIHETSCLGRCDSAPAVAVNEVPLTSAEDAVSQMEAVRQILDGEAALPEDEPTSEPRRWKVDPYSAADDRYATLRRLLSIDDGADAAEQRATVAPRSARLAPDCQPNSVKSLGDVCVEQLSAAGLRGMGGAGFPTGRKWELVRGETSDTKYVICNADESEPGTFKDRVILEELPHLVIEGMVLAGLTIGAETGIVYLRHEYSRERKALQAALEDARQRGILGDNAAGSGQRFDIEIFVSPGGYILGEETALLEALEDKRGEPRNKPPYPGQHGLWGQPTLINNVETYALATSIAHHGADWWLAQGANRDGKQYAGLKFVSVSGDVVQPGVYEISVGTPVAEVIELAGGLPEGRTLQAFLPGGASTSFLPADKVDTPLDFDAMKAAGSALGTGAVIVIDDSRDLFELATNIVRFFRNESCGKCVPCRMGSEKAVRVLEGVSAGNVAYSELDQLPVLGETLEQTSICGLGQVALNPILSLMKNIPDAIVSRQGSFDD
ncbi:MAG: NADH-ubiquinone oxidoreductase-F iron-sulfur binding region domain-containing protein [Planctomycetota bacterium]